MINYMGAFIQVLYFIFSGNLWLKNKVRSPYKYAAVTALIAVTIPIIGRLLPGLTMFFVLIILIKKKGNSWYTSIFSILFSIIVLILVESFLSNFEWVRDVLMNLHVRNALNILILMFLSLTLSYLFVYACVFLKNKLSKYLRKMGKSSYLPLSLIIFIIATTFFYYYIMPKDLSDTEHKMFGNLFVFLFTYVLFLAFTMLSIAYAGIHAAKKKEKEKQYRELEGYTSHLEDLHKNISGFKHDYVNILSSLMGYIESEDYKGLKNHLTQVIGPYSQQIMVENQSFSALMMVKIPALKGLLTVKLLEIYRLELNHRVEIIEPVETIPMDLVDLSRMLGILLDNAIEAAALSQEKHLGMALIKSPQGLTIIVENTCPEDLLPIHEMYEERKSTKGPSRGLGLYHYKAMAKAYSHVLTETFIENKVFKQVLTIGSE